VKGEIGQIAPVERVRHYKVGRSGRSKLLRICIEGEEILGVRHYKVGRSGQSK
jgi:hypothetical protein